MDNDGVPAHEDEDVTVSRASEYLQGLARQMAVIYREETRPLAILLTDSSAGGYADLFSDLDFVMYYDELPGDEQIERARSRLGDLKARPIGPRVETAVSDTYAIRGIECQVGHLLRQRVEADLQQALVEFEVDSILHKKLMGLRSGVPMHGGEIIFGGQERLRGFPDGLARAMMTHYLGQILPFWVIRRLLAQRDTGIWQRQLLVESVQQLLGVLAGLNRRYYSTFQFKREHAFISALTRKPERLAERIDELFGLPFEQAGLAVRDLVRDTLEIVERCEPGVDTTLLRGQLEREMKPWSLPGAE